MSDISWIKIDVGMFENRKIRYLRKLPEGDSIVLIWIMLLTLAGRCNAGGAIFLIETVPYTPQMLADELGFDVSTIQNALDALERLNMVVPNGSYLQIAGWSEHQNIEGMEKVREQNRIRKAAQRERDKEKQNVSSRDGHVTVTQSHVIDGEQELELEGDITPPTPSFGSELQAAVDDWLQYKAERKEAYKPQGLKAMISEINNNASEYGEPAVAALIRECMASNWRGIIFDRLKNKKGAKRGVIRDNSEEDERYGTYL